MNINKAEYANQFIFDISMFNGRGVHLFLLKHAMVVS